MHFVEQWTIIASGYPDEQRLQVILSIVTPGCDWTFTCSKQVSKGVICGFFHGNDCFGQ